jgi:hypothetical protein
MRVSCVDQSSVLQRGACTAYRHEIRFRWKSSAPTSTAEFCQASAQNGNVRAIRHRLLIQQLPAAN